MTEALHKCSVSLSLSVGISNRVSVSVSWVILGISVVFQLWIRGLTEFHCIAEHSCRDSCETWPGHVYQGKWRQSHGDSRGPGRPGDAASGAIRYLQHERMWKDVESSASLSLFEECCWDRSNVYTSPVWGAFSQHFLYSSNSPEREIFITNMFSCLRQDHWNPKHQRHRLIEADANARRPSPWNSTLCFSVSPSFLRTAFCSSVRLVCNGRWDFERRAWRPLEWCKAKTKLCRKSVL
jgi:hypothetical protein